ncbi:MAG: glycosyltransferase family 4 protein [Actinobacteria bacterium]|nr:glycosyltransferase family 4 protein [Actinomycetota bacterium]
MPVSDRLRVGLDVAALAQTRAGTARYVNGLLEHAPVDYVRLGWGGSGRLAAAARDVIWYPAWLPETAARAEIDLLHCPTFRAPLGGEVPLVVTVHDLAVLRHPGTFNRWTRAYSRVAVPRVAGAAELLIAVSEFTKRELVELLRVPERKVRVIPNGVGEPFSPAGPAAGGDYVLTVATLEPRKNLERLVVATERLGVELRVAGARGWGRVRLGGDRVRWLGEQPDEALAGLYRGAACVAYPSLYEGFGLPLVEAMACGTPVVTSAGGALEEVAGGAAVLVDPLEPGSIAAGIERAVASRDRLRRAGLARARDFDWAATARATVDVYRELAA